MPSLSSTTKSWLLAINVITTFMGFVGALYGVAVVSCLTPIIFNGVIIKCMRVMQALDNEMFYATFIACKNRCVRGCILDDLWSVILENESIK